MRFERSALGIALAVLTISGASLGDEQPAPPPADPEAPVVVDPHAAHEHAEPHDHTADEPLQVTITDDRRPRAASAVTVSGGELKMRPRLRPADIIEAVPGLFAVQHAGGGKANQYFLRGFDIDHGTDVALFVDGVPVNMPSHGHGQGYADLHFLIPELVSSLDAHKGSYDARFGDFATAGALNLKTADHFDESQASLTAGQYGILRGLVISSLEIGEAWRVVLAGEAYAQDGPFVVSEDLRRFNGFARATYDFSGASKVSLTAMSYSGKWRASGQIPLREVEGGRLDRFGSLDENEGGSTQRHALSIALDARDENASLKATLYAIRYVFRLYSNFTFFLNDPVFGDMIEQTDDRGVFGGDLRMSYHHHLGPLRLETTVGIQARTDSIENGLFHDFGRERLSTTVMASVAQTGIGVFAEEEATLGRWLKFTAGARIDRADVAVEDKLDNPSEIGSSGTGSQGSTLISPKAALVLSPLSELDLFLDFGRGFHSNDARGAARSEGRARLLTPATAYEIGARVRPVKPLTISLSAFRLDLDSEQVYVGDEGTTEPSDPTTRIGAELGARLYFGRWLFADADLALTRAEYQTGGEGNAVALAPTRTLTAGVGFRAPFGTFGSIRVRSLADRPATEDESITAEGFTVVDAQVGHRLGPVELSIDVQNLFNADWREVQFASETRLKNEPAPVEEIHFVPGWPFTIMGRVTAYWK
ncbi:MAG: TonB-dependent receptor [Polyangiaceae bacterium]|nr:TonB-dependent receptor [Polyangiaceae bacterium]